MNFVLASGQKEKENKEMERVRNTFLKEPAYKLI